MAESKQNHHPENIINELVKPLIKKRIDEEFDKYIDILKSRKAELTTGILLRVVEQIEMETLGRKIVLSFHKEDIKN